MTSPSLPLANNDGHMPPLPVEPLSWPICIPPDPPAGRKIKRQPPSKTKRGRWLARCNPPILITALHTLLLTNWGEANDNYKHLPPKRLTPSPQLPSASPARYRRTSTALPRHPTDGKHKLLRFSRPPLRPAEATELLHTPPKVCHFPPSTNATSLYLPRNHHQGHSPHWSYLSKDKEHRCRHQYSHITALRGTSYSCRSVCSFQLHSHLPTTRLSQQKG